MFEIRPQAQHMLGGLTWLGLVQSMLSHQFQHVKYHMEVSWINRGTPKSSILIGLSIVKHLFWGTPMTMEIPRPHQWISPIDWSFKAPWIHDAHWRSAENKAVETGCWTRPQWEMLRSTWKPWLRSESLQLHVPKIGFCMVFVRFLYIYLFIAVLRVGRTQSGFIGSLHYLS